ncbi:hypothetical protein [Amycolatopsis pigmentata]|uniref:Lipoprotein n=1 Tax=Amycolatopsis pigmentata TaxID=450801 RepID=A0ABW5FU13_9PSEU
MATRSLPAVIAGLAVLVSACAGGGNASTGTGDPAPGNPATSKSGPKYTAFPDFPGQALVTTEPGAPVGIQVKPIDVVWTPELAGKSAQPGEHYLAVYVAVTGELADRGVRGARLDFLQAKFKLGKGTCDEYSTGTPDFCFRKANPATGLEGEIADNTWRSRTWSAVGITRTDVKAGETLIGVVGFHIADDADIVGSMELCGPTKERVYDSDRFPCVGIPKPEGARS